MENHLKKIYSQARRDVGREWYKYMESIKPEADKLLKAYEDAKLTGDKDLIKKTGKEYGQFLRQQTYMNERYKSMLNTTTTKLANVNETALSYLNGKMPKIYATNYNQLSKDMPAGISFSLVDETTVKNLVKDNPKLLPTKKLDIPKDKRWNQKAINAQVLQSIIQGESIPEMAKRLTPIMDRNEKSAIRNARTMTTSAQNKGRLDSYEAAQDKGIVLHKVWMATNSERTRAWHAALNGVEVEIDEPFENDYGTIMFPGDPNADPGNVYNCRCTLTTKIIGFRREDGSIKYVDGEEPTTADENTFKVVNGKDISDTWTRRPDEFDFEIEDVINAQGFDGLPRVVSADEFDRYVKESNFIAQRTYVAPNSEAVKVYQDQLYNGKWYVDCSEGGSIYGKGMYTASTNGTKVNASMEAAAESYGAGDKFISDDLLNSLSKEKWNKGDELYSLGKVEEAKNVYKMNAIDFGKTYHPELMPASITETLTLTKDAKIITYTELKQQMIKEGLAKVDAGSYATLKGYDAIVAEEAGGAYGRDLDYTVILNRTKVIIKGE